jgi:hypothetical protein
VNQDELLINKLSNIKMNHFVKVMAPYLLTVGFFGAQGSLDETACASPTPCRGEYSPPGSRKNQEEDVTLTDSAA